MNAPRRVSLYQLHRERWRDGCGSDECPKARTRVLCRATALPCDVLFVGEAPGESEDCLGRPFVGPAGQLLDGIIERALPAGTKYALTNLVCCIPREGDGGKAMEPSLEQMRACRPRLEEFVRIAAPRLVVAVGSHAKKSLEQGYKDSVRLPGKVPVLAVLHPAFILRQPYAQQGILVQRCVVQISNALEELNCGQEAR